ncbi:MAG TPA: response regulator [Pyrinomonadaceae bacterium]|nr:response regulator [Pyrinomonadaceae bacterium]
MLAGRKLLLADDSVTIQKVVDLTFADEGVEVIAVGNGTEAIERLEEIAPDVVLADVFMPGKTGYEVCEYIKGNEKLHRIPVMLLVGSFEPFDEAEARRVGADDILTKPFQSIRRLIDRVGGLVTGKLDESRAETAELSHVAEIVEDSQPLDSGELKMKAADTQPLHDAMPAEVFSQQEQQAAPEQGTAFRQANPDVLADGGDVLLELDDLAPVRRASDDDFVLDLDVDETPVYEAASTFADTIESHSYQKAIEGDATQMSPLVEEDRTQEVFSAPVAAEAAESSTEVLEPIEESTASNAKASEVVGATATAGQITLDQLSPEAIDAIAKRAVEQLSEKVIQEIAWEVVPPLAELLIKRQLQEKESQSP